VSSKKLRRAVQDLDQKWEVNSMRTYEVWYSEDGLPGAIFRDDNDAVRKIHIEDGDHLEYTFEAETWEEACSIYCLRSGFGPYNPRAKPELCPNCKRAHYYPEGSGECPLCHHGAR
jgi:hypothetical protein